MKERTSTSQFSLWPEGRYVFTVAGIPEKKSTTKTTYRVWKFHSPSGKTFSPVIFPWKSKELLLAVGGIETSPDEIEWDDEKVNGKEIECRIIHEPDNSGKLREVLVDIIPYNSPTTPGTPDPDIAWDE